LDALAEANDQFHWGTKVEEVEQAARRLRQLACNPALADELEAKAIRMRTVANLLPKPSRTRRQPRRDLQPA
jgi:hypothetical protein